VRYGGNTSCVELVVSPEESLILDAGTGARPLGIELGRAPKRVNILLTHFHMDHVQGLAFFEPLHCADCEVHIWGPASPTRSLEEQLARYLSPPLFPVGMANIPSVHLHEVTQDTFQIGSVTVDAARVLHRGLTLGYRLEAKGVSLAYIPDHEPQLVGRGRRRRPEWVSGYSLAEGVDVLIHDAQYNDEEYEKFRGWGHSAVSHTVGFAGMCGARRLVLFHHEPRHSDDRCDDVLEEARDLWYAGSATDVASAREGADIDVEGWVTGDKVAPVRDIRTAPKAARA
jgi:ribonuclease BN (tRNA processing enzyme)